MGGNSFKTLRSQWEKARPHIEVADTAFTILRATVLGGGIAWLVFSHIPQDTFRDVSRIFIYFVAYTPFIYLWLFLSPTEKRSIYLFSLFFDLVFISLLVKVTGGFDSSFFNGFYLITALYSFYYGYSVGIAVAAVSTIFYLISGDFDFNKLYWTDFSVRISFLFLIALPLGMLSQKLKEHQDKIERLNRDLQAYIDELSYVQGKLIEAEKLSALGRLTADVAHEIRNPLTSIGGFVRRLNKKLHSHSKEKEYAEIVISEVEKLERILRDVLIFSREAKFHMKYQDINEPVRESLRGAAAACGKNAVRIDERLDPALPLILIDSDQVRQAIDNLLSNSIDAMPEGGTLTVKTFMEELHHVRYIAVEVTDTGTGLPGEKLNIILEPFFSTKVIGVGTGLGLSICRKIIEEHNGLVRVDSAIGKGTSFKLLFPYQEKIETGELNCWEYMKCDVKALKKDETLCPAYPNYGRICWAVAGTYCEKKISGRHAQKLGDCKKCKFYQAFAVDKLGRSS